MQAYDLRPHYYSLFQNLFLRFAVSFRSRLFATVCALVISSNLSGCATYNIQKQFATQERPDYGRVGIVSVRFQPQVQTNLLTGGKGEGVTKASAGGAAEGALYGAKCLALLYPPAVAVCYASIVIAGAATGGIEGAAKTESADKIAAAHTAVSARLNDLQLQDCIRDEVMDYAKEAELVGITVLEDQGPEDMTEVPAYHSADGGPLDTVLELGVVSIEAAIVGQKSHLVTINMDFRARLVNANDSKILDSITQQFTLAIPSTVSEEWFRDNGRMISDLVRLWYRHFAEMVVDEFFLNYRPGKTPVQSARPEIEEPYTEERSSIILDAQVLQPTYPELRPKYFGPRAYGFCEFVQVNEMEPTFRWEALPGILKGAAEGSRITDLKYDLRIFSSSLMINSFIAGRLVHKVNGLSEPQCKVPALLKPCENYFWTVRARFLLDGKRQATEWSGRYYNWGQQPWWRRRNAHPLLAIPAPNHAYYLPFRTPAPSPDEKCP